jgi:hypothetical protein
MCRTAVLFFAKIRQQILLSLFVEQILDIKRTTIITV